MADVDDRADMAEHGKSTVALNQLPANPLTIVEMLKRDRYLNDTHMADDTADMAEHGQSSGSPNQRPSNDLTFVETLNRDRALNDAHCGEVSQVSRAPITDSGKRQQQVKMVLLILLPFATLLSVALFMNTDSIFAMIQAQQTKKTVEFSVYVGRLIVVLQKEQDQSVLYLSSIGPETKFFLAQTYMETDLYLEELPYWPVGLDRSDRRFFDSKNAFNSYLQNHRDQLGNSNVSIHDEILFYKNSIDVFLIWLYDALKESRHSNLWKTLVSYQKVIVCQHYAGIERALGTTYFVEGGFSDPYLYIKYNEVVYVFKSNFEAAKKYSPLVKPISEYNVIVDGENLTNIIVRYRDQIQFQNISAPSIHAAAAWFDLMSTYLDVLFNFQTELAEDILKMLQARSRRVLTDVASSSLVICIVVISLPLTLRALYKLTNDIQSYGIVLSNKTRELDREKGRTDALFHQMLPKTMAERLTKKNSRVAEFFAEVTIFFSDIPEFTKLASQMAPMDIVCMLNYLYTRFDGRIEKYDSYKVETIRDTYMVASGLPTPNGCLHAIEIANLALDLVGLTRQLELRHLDIPTHKIDLRVGIHSGAVVAGVVGSKLPRYCLFGDTVNTAARMKTNGLPNRIHVSKATKLLLDKRDFVLKSRGKVNLKGKGKIPTYWLVGKSCDARDTFTKNLSNAGLDNMTEKWSDGNIIIPQLASSCASSSSSTSSENELSREPYTRMLTHSPSMNGQPAADDIKPHDDIQQPE